MHVVKHISQPWATCVVCLSQAFYWLVTAAAQLCQSFGNESTFLSFKSVILKQKVSKVDHFSTYFVPIYRCWSKSFASENLINHNTMITVANCYYLTFWCLWWAKELLVICHSIEPAQNNETEAIYWAGLGWHRYCGITYSNNWERVYDITIGAVAGFYMFVFQPCCCFP